MSSIVYVVVAFIIGIVAGPSVRLLIAQGVTDLKAKYEKEKALLVAQISKAESDLAAYKAEAEKIIVDLKTDLATAEAKVATFTSLFASVPQPSVVPAPTETVAPINTGTVAVQTT